MLKRARVAGSRVAAMKKLDLRKDLKAFYAPPSKSVVVVDVPAFTFIMIDGVIQPGQEPGASPEFQEAMQALYGVSYTLKFMIKQRKVNPVDYPVMALEGLWWTNSGAFDPTRKETWNYTVMMMQPDLVTPAVFAEAIAKLRDKRGDSPALARLRLESFHEGTCMQVMHIGPYAAEPDTIARMHAFASQNGYVLRGKHHEIYLGDPRRAAPEKLKTVLRQPIARVA